MSYKIEIGSGAKPHKGYQTIDVRDDVGADIVGDFRQMSLKDVDELRSHHVLEHFSRDESIQILKKWYQWMKPGGILIIETPDFEGICENFHKDPYWMTRHAYGSQEYDWAFHKDGWYQAKYEEILPNIGFDILEIRKSVSRKILPNITVVAKKNIYNQRYFRNNKKFQANPQRIKELVDIVKQYNPTSVLDVGCGIGVLVRALNAEGIKTRGIDFAECLEGRYWDGDYYDFGDAKKLPYKDKEFDLVISTDVLEHIDEKDLDEVLNEMRRVGKTVISRVAYEDRLSREQGYYHLTNKPKEWWEQKLTDIKLV